MADDPTKTPPPGVTPAAPGEAIATVPQPTPAGLTPAAPAAPPGVTSGVTAPAPAAIVIQGQGQIPVAGVIAAPATSQTQAALSSALGDYRDYATARASYGKLLIAIGIGLLVLLFVVSLWTLPWTRPSADLTWGLAVLGAHALVALAAAFFAYQLIRAGERLLIPARVIESADVDVIRALTGVDTPASVARKALKEGVAMGGDLVTKAGDAAAKIATATKGGTE
jgi:hypothetical protein